MSQQHQQPQHQSSTASSVVSTASSAVVDQLRIDLHRFVDQAVDRLRDGLAAQRDAEIDRLTRSNSRLAALLSHERSVTKHQAQQIRILRDSTTACHHDNEEDATDAVGFVPGIRKRRNREASDSSLSAMTSRDAGTAAARKNPSQPKRRRTQPAVAIAVSPKQPPQQSRRQSANHYRLRRSSRRSKSADNNDDDDEDSTLADQEDSSTTGSLVDISNESSSACNRLGIGLSPPSRLLAAPAQSAGAAEHNRPIRTRSAAGAAAIVDHRDLQLNSTGASIAVQPHKTRYQQQQQQHQASLAAFSNATSAGVADISSSSNCIDVKIGCNFQKLDSTTVLPAGNFDRVDNNNKRR
uniref:Shugoshin_C domain-containing protein n=1 Tax=Macrostomum lignano TaxID=282301 RepID=A0A1I8GZL8_9PLAT